MNGESGSPMPGGWGGTDFGEKVIIVMIGVEIILGIAGIWATIHEGNSESTELTSLLVAQKSSTDALSTMNGKLTEMATSMDKMGKAVSDSAEYTSHMNTALQASVRNNQRMADALQKQLAILEADQKARQAELARKPIPELHIGGIPLAQAAGQSIPFKEVTDTKISFEAQLFNMGDAPMHSGLLRIFVTTAGVQVESDPPSNQVKLPAGTPGQTVVIPFQWLPEKTWLLTLITVRYPSGMSPFDVNFNVDVDGLGAHLPLGSLHITPPAKT